MSKIPVVIYF
jgi:hypothetical protein